MRIKVMTWGAVLTVMAVAGAQARPAPAFSLSGVDGETYSLDAYKGKYVVLEWTNYECPFVKKHYDSDNMQKLQKTCGEKGVAWFTINSSAPGKQGNYTPERWAELNKQNGNAAEAVLLDPDGSVGHAYGAKSTPHMFVIDPEGNIIYEGAIDDQASWKPETVEGAANYVTAALDAAMAGNAVAVSETKAYGCSVKY